RSARRHGVRYSRGRIQRIPDWRHDRVLHGREGCVQTVIRGGYRMPSHRLLRVRELLKREIGEAIRRELPVHQAGLVTVSDVDVTGDLKNARVLLGLLGNAEHKKITVDMLNKSRALIQSH